MTDMTANGLKILQNRAKTDVFETQQQRETRLQPLVRAARNAFPGARQATRAFLAQFWASFLTPCFTVVKTS